MKAVLQGIFFELPPVTGQSEEQNSRMEAVLKAICRDLGHLAHEKFFLARSYRGRPGVMIRLSGEELEKEASLVRSLLQRAGLEFCEHLYEKRDPLATAGALSASRGSRSALPSAPSECGTGAGTAGSMAYCHVFRRWSEHKASGRLSEGRLRAWAGSSAWLRRAVQYWQGEHLKHKRDGRIAAELALALAASGRDQAARWALQAASRLLDSGSAALFRGQLSAILGNFPEAERAFLRSQNRLGCLLSAQGPGFKGALNGWGQGPDQAWRELHFSLGHLYYMWSLCGDRGEAVSGPRNENTRHAEAGPCRRELEVEQEANSYHLSRRAVSSWKKVKHSLSAWEKLMLARATLACALPPEPDYPWGS